MVEAWAADRLPSRSACLGAEVWAIGRQGYKRPVGADLSGDDQYKGSRRTLQILLDRILYFWYTLCSDDNGQRLARRLSSRRDHTTSRIIWDDQLLLSSAIWPPEAYWTRVLDYLWSFMGIFVGYCTRMYGSKRFAWPSYIMGLLGEKYNHIYNFSLYHALSLLTAMKCYWNLDALMDIYF